MTNPETTKLALATTDSDLRRLALQIKMLSRLLDGLQGSPSSSTSQVVADQASAIYGGWAVFKATVRPALVNQGLEAIDIPDEFPEMNPDFEGPDLGETDPTPPGSTVIDVWKNIDEGMRDPMDRLGDAVAQGDIAEMRAATDDLKRCIEVARSSIIQAAIFSQPDAPDDLGL